MAVESAADRLIFLDVDDFGTTASLYCSRWLVLLILVGYLITNL